MAKERMASEKTLAMIEQLQKTTSRKFAQWKRYDEDVMPTDFGFKNYILEEPKNLTVKQANRLLKDIRSFNEQKFKMVNISASDVPKDKRQYVPNSKLDMIADLQFKVNRFATAHQQALQNAKFYYFKTDPDTDEVQKVERTMYEAFIDKTSGIIPTIYTTDSGKRIGKKVKGFEATVKKITKYNIDEIIGHLKTKATTMSNIRIQKLMDNYFKAVENKISTSFSNGIRNMLTKLGVTPVEFLYLFDTTEVFDFSFVYDPNIDIGFKEDEIVSEVENIRKNNIDFKDFKKVMEKYEKSLSIWEKYEKSL